MCFLEKKHHKKPQETSHNISSPNFCDFFVELFTFLLTSHPRSTQKKRKKEKKEKNSAGKNHM